MPKVAFITLGCKVNQFETETLEGLFLAKGYEIVAFEEKADVYVINTCSVTHLGEKKSRQYIRRANRLNPEAVVAVTGCYAQVAADQVAAIDGVDVIIGTQNRQGIVELVETASKHEAKLNVVTNIMDADAFEEIPLFSMPGRTRAFLKIQEGCTNFCTYCIIPYARGPLRSRPLSGILSEVEKLTSAGFQEIVLTGIHLGAYGRDLAEPVTLTDVMKAITELPDVVRLRLSSLESIEVSPEMVELLKANNKLCRHLHLPLQSGSNTILKAMNRHYTTSEYSELIGRILTEIPDLALSTDLIVGFPGETDQLFAETVSFVEKMPFSKMHIFPYSKRIGTPAADFAGQIPEEIKKERVHVIQQIAEKKAAIYAKQFVGQTVNVLFETWQDGVLEGHTEHYLKVYMPSDKDLTGTIQAVTATELWRDGLLGSQDF
ncbi:MAG: tRNA (N(6)-L-threonylcarbamoyladenosine(37)-C(2))-methylthiotransferase MtaB [Sporomusaceae bacterium]|nr:tRNA (N(6)-L-threonylcarbamoyladenosine(37)-C(2))-methylthiotransferase MtaB [Sporomusaceae bacterium]